MLYPTTCVGLGYGRGHPNLRGFSRKHGPRAFAPRREPLSRLRLMGAGICPASALHAFTGKTVSRRALPSPSPRRKCPRHGNIDPLSVGCAFRPRLRCRLTLPRLTLDRNPWSSGARIFHPRLVTHVSIRASDASTERSRSASPAY